MELRWLIQSALTNAATVVLLAGIVLIVDRCLRRPALTHALWVLVLIKLVTPPLVGVPVPREWLPDSVAGFARSHLLDTVPEMVEHSRGTPAPDPETGTFAADSEQASAGPGPAPPAAAGVSAQSSAKSAGFVPVLLSLWLAGTLFYLLAVAARIVHFSLRLRTGAGVIPEADVRAIEIGWELGLKRIPSVTFIGQPCSPMLWGLGRFTRIVFPAVLWNQLDPARRDALLTHELAHYRRCDHWIRPLEILVTGLFWWNPVVWWVRREVEAAEEACCDAWVVRQSPVAPRTYAEALLAAVDYIASDSPSTVPAGTGIGGAPDLRHRLRRIMHRSDSPLLPDSGRWLLCIAVLLLPLHPYVTVPVSATTRAAHVSGTDMLSPPLPVTDAPVSSPRTEEHAHPVDWSDPTGWWTEAPGSRWAEAESANGRFRLLAVTGNRVFLADEATGRRNDLGAAQITAAAFAPDNRHFVAASGDLAVRVWDATDGEPQSLLGPHEAHVTTVAVSPTGEIAASGSRDGALLIWDLVSEVVLATWTDSHRPIASVRIASDGRTIAVASGDWRSSESARITLLTLESESVQPAGVLRLDRPVAAIEFAEGDDALLAAAWDGTVVRWDLVGGTSSPVGVVDRSVINAATFSPDIRFADRIQRPQPVTSPYLPEWIQIGGGLDWSPEAEFTRSNGGNPVFDDSSEEQDRIAPVEVR